MKTFALPFLPLVLLAAFSPSSMTAGGALPPLAAEASSHCPAGQVWDEKRKRCVRAPRGSHGGS